MSEPLTPPGAIPPEILKYYESGLEVERLSIGEGQLERVRTQELLTRYLPPPPAVIFEVGGGPGVYSCWLARQGFEVHLVDPVPLHVERAWRASRAQPDHALASVCVGDTRQLNRADGSVDAVLLFGPLYHLTERRDRLAALREARRVVRTGSPVLVTAICRFASVLDGLARGFLDDPEFARIVQRDLSDGQHRNPTNNLEYFTTTFFHHPDELKAEIEESGLRHDTTLAVEGVGLLPQDFEERWKRPDRRSRLLDIIRALESEPSMLGVSPHLMALARKAS